MFFVVFLKGILCGPLAGCGKGMLSQPESSRSASPVVNSVRAFEEKAVSATVFAMPKVVTVSVQTTSGLLLPVVATGPLERF